MVHGTPIYTVNVYSSPTTRTPPVGEDGSISFNRETDLREAPWVVTFDNFLTDEECEHLIQQGYKNGYKRSTDVGTRQVDGSFGTHQSKGRTSENSWCDPKSGCRQDPIAQRVMERIANVTGIPSEKYEDFQLLKVRTFFMSFYFILSKIPLSHSLYHSCYPQYDVGQFYNAHHDYIGHQRDRHSGPRILTFFLYQSDVEKGGGTRLNNLKIDIMPKRGSALLWPSVLSSDPR